MASIAYTEDDKLGPLGARVSALRAPSEVRATLLHEFHATVQAAKEAANSVDHGAPAAVHGARKALRRARAILALVADALPKSERRAVRRALQEARRALSTIRDHAVAPDTLARLTLSDGERMTAKRVLDNAAEALPATAEIKQLLAEAATRAAAQAEALEAALPEEIDWAIVLEGVRDCYAEARSARRSSKDSKGWFHAWRRRTKELSYQLALLANHTGPRVAAIQAEIEAVGDTLSPAVDLVMLRDFVRTYGQGVAAEDLEQLEGTIQTLLSDLMKDARKIGRDAFVQKPRRFAKRLAKSVKRDLTPADDAHAASEHDED